MRWRGTAWHCEVIQERNDEKKRGKRGWNTSHVGVVAAASPVSGRLNASKRLDYGDGLE